MNLNVVAASIATVVFAAVLLWGQWAVRRQQRVLGRQRYRDCVSTTQMLRRFSPRMAVPSALRWAYLVGGVLILLRASSLVPVLIALWLLLTVISWGAQQSIPGSIVVLGSSNEQQIALQASIRDAVWPFRPVSLLQTDRLAVDMKIHGDCFRIGNEVDWREAVSALCRSAPLIVLDIRNVTPAVRHEIEHVFKSGYAYKTLFIGPDDASVLDDGRLQAESPGSLLSVLRLSDSASGVALLRYILHIRKSVPTPDAPLSSLSLEWGLWLRPNVGRSATPVADPLHPSGEDTTEGWQSTEVHCSQLAPFSYQKPGGWQARVLSEKAQEYAILFRPPEESEGGLRGLLRRRSRLDMMVFKYTSETISDEAAFRRATEVNLMSRGASIVQDTIGRRFGVMSHECFFRRGTAHGYLVRFIARGNEYVVQWTTMDAAAMQRHMPTVQEFVDRLRA